MLYLPAQITSVAGRNGVYSTRARNIDIQHANMSSENDTGHFTWFLNVLRAFLADSELLWALFYFKKC